MCYKEIKLPQPCDFQRLGAEGKREAGYSEKVRIETDQPTNGGDLRIVMP